MFVNAIQQAMSDYYSKLKLYIILNNNDGQ